MNRPAEIETEAARWILQQEEPDWTADDQARFDGWLEQSAAHQAAYWRLEHGWRRADRIAAHPVPQPEVGRRWRFNMPAAIAASLALLLGGGVWLSQPFLRHTYSTGIGGHEVVPLPDGSRMELNTDTRLRSDISDERRAVWLDRGEAYFEVAHDAAKPFVIYAGERKVTVLGTRFSVRREGDEVKVTVVEGKVRVDAASPAVAAPPAVLTPGQSALANGGAATLITPRTVEAATAELSWRKGLLVFDGFTVARAAEEFNRYNRRKIVVESQEAGDIPIGGVFETENVEGFVELLEQGYGLKVRNEGEQIRIIG